MLCVLLPEVLFSVVFAGGAAECIVVRVVVKDQIGRAHV